MKKKFSLTPSEERVMEILWTEKHPMTSVELAEHAEGENWKSSYVYILIRSLLKKGMIEVCGSVQYASQYARQFRPLLTKEEYAAKLALSLDLDSGSVSKVAVALAQGAKADSDQIIQQLEDIILQLRQNTEE